MISLKTFTQTIQDGLNAISGINFKVFADAGKYEKAIVKPLYKTKFTSCYCARVARAQYLRRASRWRRKRLCSRCACDLRPKQWTAS